MYYGLSHKVDKNDPRQKEWKKQRDDRGFDNTELWQLHYTIIQFALPRLKVFKHKAGSYPGCLSTLEDWKDILQQIIDGFELFLNDDNACFDDDKQKTINISLDLFREWFFDFWG